jgi:hypothetical protein
MERVALPQLRLSRCEQCQDNGWGTCRMEGRCSTSDDFASVVDRLMAAHVCVPRAR